MKSKICLMLTGFVLSSLFMNAQTRPITDAEALAEGHRIEAATNSGNYYPIDHFVCGECLLERTRKASKVLKDPDNLRSFASGFVPSVGNYSKQIIAGIKGGNYCLLKEFDHGGVKHLLFRMFGTGGLTYHDYMLTRVGDSIRASDVYLYSADEWYSTTVAQLADAVGAGNSMIDDTQVILNMVSLTQQKNYAAVKDNYDKLDKKYKDNKVVDFMYVKACYHIDQKLYQQALEDYSGKFPGAVSCKLMLADLYYMQKEYEKNIAINNQIDSLIGGDPLMDFMRGGAYRAAGKTAESVSYFEKAYRYDPSIQLNSVMLAKSYAEAGQKDKAKKVLAGYMRTPRYHEGDLDAFFTKNPDLK